MTIVFTLIAISIHTIFLFKRELLFDKKSFKTIMLISIGLVGLYITTKIIGYKSKNIEMLNIPFLVLAIFFILSKCYNKLFKQNPADTFWTMDISLMKDGLFNFLFWVLGLVLPIILVTTMST